jgi:hypothetical protein
MTSQTSQSYKRLFCNHYPKFYKIHYPSVMNNFHYHTNSEIIKRIHFFHTIVQARWSDNLRRRVAEDRARWREIGEAYVQQWTVVG